MTHPDDIDPTMWRDSPVVIRRPTPRDPPTAPPPLTFREAPALPDLDDEDAR